MMHEKGKRKRGEAAARRRRLAGIAVAVGTMILLVSVVFPIISLWNTDPDEFWLTGTISYIVGALTLVGIALLGGGLRVFLVHNPRDEALVADETESTHWHRLAADDERVMDETLVEASSPYEDRLSR